MLMQILTHTPVHVWAILALLVYRGVVAMREREVEFRKLLIIPVIMLALSLHDIATKFGIGFLPFAAWAAGAVGMTLLVWKFSNPSIAAGSTPGSVRVRGSSVPLAMMMAIFVTTYVTAVTLVMQPHVSQNALFSGVVCILFGVANGYFMGRLAGDMNMYKAFRTSEQGSRYAASPA